MAMSFNSQRRDFLKTATWLVGGSLGVFSGCSRYMPPNPIDEIRLAVPDVAPRLDPRFATDAFSTRIGRLIYPALIDFDASSTPSPWLATHWQWLDTNRLWVGLRQDIYFHHGRLLTNADVVATYQSILDARLASPLKGPLRNLVSVESADDGGVIFHWQKPDQLSLFRLTVPILPADLLSAGHDFQQEPIGCGACRLISAEDQELVLARVDGTKLRFIGVKDASVRLLKLVRNEVDLLLNDLSPELVRHARTRGGLVIESMAGSGFSYIGMNLQDPLLSQLPVRRALAHAIDRNSLSRYLMDELATPCQGIFPAGHWCGLPTITPGYAYDPALASKLLKEANVSSGTQLVFKTSTDATRIRVASVYQQMLKEIGINLIVESHDWGTFYSDIKQGNFQLYGLSWVGVKSPEIFEYAFASYSLPPIGANRGHYQDEMVDMLIQQALTAPDMPAMSRYYQQIQLRLLETLPVIPLWHDHQVMVRRDNVRGYVLHNDGRYDGLLTVNKVSG